MTDSSRVGKNKHVKEVRKPFMTGTPKDENTLKSALKFFGLMIVIIFVAFITCASTATGAATATTENTPRTIATLPKLFIIATSPMRRETPRPAPIPYYTMSRRQSVSGILRRPGLTFLPRPAKG